MALAVAACGCGTERPPQLQPVESLPPIFPDYIGVTIPAEIAPMDFNIDSDDAAYVYARVTGSQGGEIEGSGAWARFDIDEWHRLTELNRGGTLTFDVSVRDSQGRWTRYQPFEMHVSPHPLADYGVTYRRIAPGFETFSKIGIYQRELSTFSETPILEETAVGGQCLNCHYANRGNPDQMSIHVRGANGGTLLCTDGRLDYLNTKAPETAGNCTYGYWHPDGRYCAYSLNRIYQNFYVGRDKMVEPWDYFSDIVVLDTRTNQLVTSPLLSDDDCQTTPAFSADGATLYFCHAPKHNMPAEYADLRYSLCAIAFDAATGTLGDTVTTIVHADSINRSLSLPRPSYDGRYLMYCLTDYGTTPVDHEDSDLYIMDLATGESRCMSEVNSDETDAYHNWSSGSRWWVFASRRHDRMNALLYFSCIGNDGVSTKPFLMPQRNPRKYYLDNFHSFNVPDFTTRRVTLDPVAAHTLVMSGETTPVEVRK